MGEVMIVGLSIMQTWIWPRRLYTRRHTILSSSASSRSATPTVTRGCEEIGGVRRECAPICDAQLDRLVGLLSQQRLPSTESFGGCFHQPCRITNSWYLHATMIIFSAFCIRAFTKFGRKT